ncbi:MAG TPA: zinc ribbon domain-containing protein [Blastocatellia bacterium]|nr:zinc ribbon domain-containing protein [Blastocatellia bacterium]
MYCPRCATQNSDDTKFCRSCGVNLSLVPQALTGRLPDARTGRRGRHREGRLEKPPNLTRGITQLFTGLGFIVIAVAILFSPNGGSWWWAMLFPAFALLSKGIAEIVGAKTSTSLPPATNHTTMPPARVTDELPPRPTYDPLPPPSVTEGTTRHLDPASDSYKERR